MSQRSLILTLLAGMALAAGWAVLAQHHDLALLRARYRQLENQSAADQTGTLPRPATTLAGGSPGAGGREVLQLRNEITRLSQRRQELEGIRAENEQLRAQEAASRTNGAAAQELPAGYLRKAQARMVGYGSPEDTLQTLLWAVQNRDLEHTVQAFAPSTSPVPRPSDWAARLFTNLAGLPGWAVVQKQTSFQGETWVTVEIAPDFRKHIPLKSFDGEWRITGNPADL